MIGGASRGFYQNFPMGDRGGTTSSVGYTWRLLEVTYDYDNNSDAKLPEVDSLMNIKTMVEILMTTIILDIYIGKSLGVKIS